MTESEREHQNIQHLSHEDVAHLVGDLEDATVAAILATGATYQEVEQALKWRRPG